MTKSRNNTPIKLSKLVDLLKVNQRLLVVALVVVSITVPTTLYLSERQNSRQSAMPAPVVTASEKNDTKEAAEETLETTKNTPSDTSATTTSKPNNTPSSSTQNTTTQPTNNPPTPTKKEPYTFTFASGTRTAQWYAGGTFFPGNDYSDEWLSITSKADATGFLNFRFSYNCSSGDACPAILLQGSSDGNNWITYRNLSRSLSYPYNYGTFEYPVLYPYYRLLLNQGACSSNACPPPTPPFAITYELAASGYFYY